MSKQYENKIDRIEVRLANIERLLQERLPSTPQSTTTPARPDTAVDPVIEVDGYTGPHADSLAAKDAFEQVAGGNPTIASDESLKAALSSLRGIIDRIKGDDQTNASRGIDARDISLPAWADTQQVLQQIERRSCSIFTQSFCH